MKKCILGFFLFVMLFSLCACTNNCDIKKDSNGRVIMETYYDDNGNVTEERTFTYYENGEKCTRKTVFPQADGYSPGIIEIQWSEDGLSERTLTYNVEGMLTDEVYFEFYDSEEENWHKEFDGVQWRLCRSNAYYKNIESSHAEFEYLEDNTYVQRIYTPEGIIQEENIYQWCSEHGAWDKLIKTKMYDSEGNLMSEY